MYIYRFCLKVKVIFLSLLILSGSLSAAAEPDQDLFTLEALSSPQQLATPFALSAEFKDGKAVFSLTAPDNCYTYLDKIKLQGAQVSFTPPVLPAGVIHTDPTGSLHVIFGSFAISCQILKSAAESTLTLTLQGCDEQGVCYPPQAVTLTLPAYLKSDLSPLGDQNTQDHKLSDETDSKGNDSAGIEQTGQDSGAQEPLTLLLCFLLGIGLILTPCVLPMLSIYSAMILGHQSHSFGRSLCLNLSYLLGLCATFALLGLIFARVGLYAHGYLQHPVILVLIALLLIYCALDCMGVVKFKLPQRFIAVVSARMALQNAGSLRSAFLFGALSALLATPCTSAPLAGSILYILQSGDLIYGTLMFLLIGLGMGMPLVLVGLFGNSFLPKSGTFSELIHKLLALPLLYAAFYITEHLFTPYTDKVQALVLSLLTGYFVFCLLRWRGLSDSLLKILSLGVILLTLLISLQFNLNASPPLPYTKLNTLMAMQDYAGKKLIVTFSASWCHNCHELDQNIYTKKEYQEITQGYTTLRFDLSDPHSEESRKLIERFALVGVPQLYVIDKAGNIRGGLSGLFTLEDLSALLTTF